MTVEPAAGEAENTITLQPAGSETGGDASESSEAAASMGGGATAAGVPVIRNVICASGCVGLREPTRGGTVQVTGRRLGSVTRISFPGRRRRVVVPVHQSTATMVMARVPKGAFDGRIWVRDAFGNASPRSRERLDIRPLSELGSAGAMQIAEAITTPRRAFFFGLRRPRLTYILRSDRRLNDLRIDVLSASGQIVRSYFRDDVEANTVNSIRWNGRDADGRIARNGRYAFRIKGQSGRAARLSRTLRRELSFRLFAFIFPIRGPHTYGDGIGAPRGGRLHQGQDVFAACGTEMVAARGGRVEYSGYQGAAGHYVVIDGLGTGVDFVYMHLLGPSPAKPGRVVRTGQLIGRVGETGNAVGCHLHYEMWSAPGWYTGGSFMDPTPFLKRWDRYS